MFSAFWDAKTARVLFTVLIFTFALAFLYGARETLTLFLFAILFAYFVEPLVGLLSRPLRGRTRAILLRVSSYCRWARRMAGLVRARCRFSSSS